MTGTWKSVLLSAVVSAAVGCTGCGGSDDDATGKKPKKSGGETPVATTGGGGKYDASKSTGVVKIVVKWTGEKPAQQAVPITEESCKTPAGVMAERFVVNADGTLPNAFVWASEGPHKGMSGLPDSPHVTLDQHGCMYVPHIFGLRKDQMFTVKNSDGVKHNVHARPSTNTNEINQSQDKGATNDFKFDQTERAIPFNCDVHSWMNATAFVLDHPFFGTTGADGSVTIKGLPAGDYTFKAWHEKFKGDKDYQQEVKITVKEGGTAEQTVELK